MDKNHSTNDINNLNNRHKSSPQYSAHRSSISSRSDIKIDRITRFDTNLLRKFSNHQELYTIIKKLAYNKKHIEEFLNYFYQKKNRLTSKEFITIGIFEHLSYYQFYNDDYKLNSLSEQMDHYDIAYWRRIKGDGNCYYRAVLISYIELLILNSYTRKSPMIFFGLIKDVALTEFPKNKQNIKRLMMTSLIAIYESIKKGVEEETFEIVMPSREEKSSEKNDKVDKNNVEKIDKIDDNSSSKDNFLSGNNGNLNLKFLGKNNENSNRCGNGKWHSMYNADAYKKSISNVSNNSRSTNCNSATSNAVGRVNGVTQGGTVGGTVGGTLGNSSSMGNFLKLNNNLKGQGQVDIPVIPVGLTNNFPSVSSINNLENITENTTLNNLPQSLQNTLKITQSSKFNNQNNINNPNNLSTFISQKSNLNNYNVTNSTSNIITIEPPKNTTTYEIDNIDTIEPSLTPSITPKLCPFRSAKVHSLNTIKSVNSYSSSQIPSKNPSNDFSKNMSKNTSKEFSKNLSRDPSKNSDSDINNQNKLNIPKKPSRIKSNSINYSPRKINKINKTPTNKHMQNSFDILYRTYNKSDIIEKAMIQWIRIKLTSFLKNNLELEFNGLKLVQCIPGFELENDLSYNKENVFKYIDNELMKMDEYVEGYPLYITSFILKTDVNIFFLDEDNKPLQIDLKYYGDIDKNIMQSENYLYDFNNSLGCYNEINVLYAQPHYEVLSSEWLVDKICGLYGNNNIKLSEGEMNKCDYNSYNTDLSIYKNMFGRVKNQFKNVDESLNDNISRDTSLNDSPNFNRRLSKKPSNIFKSSRRVSELSSFKFLQKLTYMPLKIKDSENQNLPLIYEFELKKENFHKDKNECSLCGIHIYKFEKGICIKFPCEHSFCKECFGENAVCYLNGFNGGKPNFLADFQYPNRIWDMVKFLNQDTKFVNCLVGDKCDEPFDIRHLKRMFYIYYCHVRGKVVNENKFRSKDKLARVGQG